MSFTLPQYHEPDFQETRFQSASEARFEPAPKDEVVPEGYHAITIYPEYFKVRGRWLLTERSRMDHVTVLWDGKIATVEFRNLRADEPVAVGHMEDASKGIYVCPFGSTEKEGEAETFALRQSRSRETVYSMDCDSIYRLLRHKKEHGRIPQVMRPARTFDHDARAAFAVLIRDGYVHGLLVGNALATCDLETSYLSTAPGQDIYTQKSMPNGHYNHINTLNAIRLCNSTAALVEAGKTKDGTIYECVHNHIPYVLVGSVRDDGPLLEVYGNVYEGRNAMRTLIRGAATVVRMVSTLHTMTTDNITSSYRVVDRVVRPVYSYSVDVSKFAVSRLRDRGSLSVRTTVTSVQDFMVNVCKGML